MVSKYSRKKPLKYSMEETSDTIRLFAFSDWRVQNIEDIYTILRENDPVDFIVYAGDDLFRFYKNGINHLTYLSFLTKQKMVLSVIGNDDLYSVSKQIISERGIHDLYDKSLETENYKFIGLEASTTPPAIFMHDENDFKKHLQYQKKDLEKKEIIIVSHAPPFGLLDRGVRYATTNNGTHHIGSTALREFIDSNQVKLVICGHCHSYGGMIQKHGSTLVVNVSSHDNQGAKGNFCFIEINPDSEPIVTMGDTDSVRKTWSLSNLWGIGYVYQEKLESCNICTIEDMASIMDLESLSVQSGLSIKYLKKFQLFAQSMINNEIIQISEFDFDHSNQIFFDIETDLACDRVWLIGVLNNNEFLQFFADNWEEEKNILDKFIDLLKSNGDGTLVSYSGTNFDYRVILNALIRQGLDTEFFSAYPHVDLCLSLRRSFAFPNQSFKLKELGSYLEYPFQHEDMHGFLVASHYHDYVENKNPLDPSVFSYNEDDVRAIPYLIDKMKAQNSD